MMVLNWDKLTQKKVRRDYSTVFDGKIFKKVSRILSEVRQNGDLAVRRQWAAYQRAYEDVLSRCSTRWAPWFVVPANKKWFRNLAVSEILRATLEDLHPQFPKPLPGINKIRVV